MEKEEQLGYKVHRVRILDLTILVKLELVDIQVLEYKVKLVLKVFKVQKVLLVAKGLQVLQVSKVKLG